MTIKIHDNVEQGSDEWHAMRCGLLTASEMKHVLTPTLKVANNDKTRTHVYELASQRITQYVEPSYINDDMLRGWEDEITSRDLYSEHYEPVKEVGFITREVNGVTVGYSPDGLVGDDGLIEIKSRIQKHHLNTITSNEVPTDYIMQCQTALFVTQRKWIDYISYCGGLPLWVIRMYPLPEYQDAIALASREFELKVQEQVAIYQDRIKELGDKIINTERKETGIIGATI